VVISPEVESVARSTERQHQSEALEQHVNQLKSHLEVKY